MGSVLLHLSLACFPLTIDGSLPDCAGIGEKRVISFDRLIPDKTLSLRGGAVVCNGFKSIDDDTWMGPLFKAVGEKA